MGIGELDFNNDDCEELTMIIQLSNALTFLMIERLLGGNGKAASVDRDFTEIEVSIMQEITEQFAKIMKEPWQSVANVTPKLKKIETNARMVTGMSFDDVMIIAALEVVVSDSSSIISVCIPARALEENMQKLASAGAVQIHRKININKENERRETIMKTLADSKLEVKAILGNVNLDVSDVLNLQINDVIPLKKSIGSNVPIMVGDKLWFDGKVGIYNNNKAVKIERVLKKQPKNTNEFIELFPAN
jgi:flagellar motor switch protein FliM